MSEKKKSLFGIWKKTVNTKNGPAEVLSFSVNGTRYTAWANSYKNNEKSPDYNAYVDDYVKPAQNTPLQTETPKMTNQSDGLPF